MKTRVRQTIQSCLMILAICSCAARAQSVTLLDPPELGFFSKQLISHGVPIKAHKDVSDDALREAGRRIGRMLENLPDAAANLADAGSEVQIIGKDQQVSDLPELRQFKGKPWSTELGQTLTIDERTRGVGGLHASCGEENLLKLPSDRYKDHRDICSHEFAHTLLAHGLTENVRARVRIQYAKSISSGLWKTAYASTNYDEFFAELTMWYFDSRGDYGKLDPKPQEGRDWLRQYDPDAFAMMDDIYSGRMKTHRITRTASSAAVPSKKTNVLFILTDDMGWGDLGCFGNKETATPNIDRLAKGGTRFTQFYVASPICSPSRVAYLTGAFPARWRINDYLHAHAGNQAHECADWLDPKAPTLARTLHDVGYSTAHFGKWHMGGGRDVQDAPWPKEYGFDEHHVNCEGCGPRIDTYGSAVKVAVEDKMLARYEFTGFWADKAIDFMRRHKEGPFFVELWPQDVHTPHVPDPEELPFVAATPVPHQKFNAVLRRYDREIGRVLDFLKAENLEQNTLVIFASDNGPEPSFQRQRTGGLRGMKWSLYEGGIREPMLIRWPGHIPAGNTDSKTVLGSVDLFPTICALTGVGIPKDAAPDGVDASAAWRGTPMQRPKPLFWEYGRQADYNFPKEPGARSPNLAIREGNLKLLINADGTGAELYDLAADPNESSDLASKKPDEAARLSAAVLAWRKSLP